MSIKTKYFKNIIIRASTNCELAKIKHERIHLIFDSRREDCIKSKLEFLNDIDLFKGWEAMHLNRVASVLKTVMYLNIVIIISFSCFSCFSFFLHFLSLFLHFLLIIIDLLQQHI